ncbi:MAG: L-fucose:H+ symporter permease [Alphaproteobacteria bacterium]|nr:L-fucose:H+ symporter permease [Alphaproteobacteria bacterium]
MEANVTGQNETTRERTRFVPFILIVSLFFLWGIANNLNDVLVAQFRKTFVLDDLESGLVQSAFYFGYFLFALPASLFMRRYGYKAAVALGLCLYGIGALLFYPAAELRVYGFFLGSLFVIASGLAFLETSANPLVTVLGSARNAERRLNFVQAFNSLGAISGALIGRQFILSGIDYTPAQLTAMPHVQVVRYYASESHAVQGPYLVLGAFVLFWMLLVLGVRFPSVAAAHIKDEEAISLRESFMRLLKRGHYLFGVVAQFFYVGAQVGVWSFMIRYAERDVPHMTEKLAAAYLTGTLVAFMIGRFSGTAAMGIVRPNRLLVIFSAINVALTLIAALVGGQVGLYALVATSFFMSIMFPTIFASALRGLGPLTKSASSFLIMSIVGGAVLTAVMGWVSDMTDIRYAMLVPTMCFAVVFAFAASVRREVLAP